MGRPKQYEQIDEGAYVPHTEQDTLVAPAWAKEVLIDPEERKKSLRIFANLHHRVPNGYNDPITVLMVLDLLQRWSPNYYIRSKYVAKALNDRQPTIYFEPRTVGRILNEIAEIAAEEYASDKSLIPLMSTRDYQNTIYFVNSHPAAYRWFWKLRQQLDQLAIKVMEREGQGIPPRKRASVFAEIDTEAVK